MSDSSEVVIIGGGVMGCSIQHGLAENGVTNSLLLEQNELASGSTSRSQAILRMHYSNEVTARLAWESLKIFKEFKELVGTPSGYTKTGYLLIVSGEDAQPMRENVAMQILVSILGRSFRMTSLVFATWLQLMKMNTTRGKQILDMLIHILSPPVMPLDLVIWEREYRLRRRFYL